jgi:hypothetical protein
LWAAPMSRDVSRSAMSALPASVSGYCREISSGARKALRSIGREVNRLAGGWFRAIA